MEKLIIDADRLREYGLNRPYDMCEYYLISKHKHFSINGILKVCRKDHNNKYTELWHECFFKRVG